MRTTPYRVPDFTITALRDAPDAEFRPMPQDGVLPDGFFSTTKLPTYVRVNGTWRRPREPRMDCAIVLDAGGDLVVREPRRLSRGTLVAIGEHEHGSGGICVDYLGFRGEPHSANQFRFMSTPVSRERPVDYGRLAAMLGEERDRGGQIVWVAGPAVLHARACEDLIWFPSTMDTSVLSWVGTPLRSTISSPPYTARSSG